MFSHDQFSQLLSRFWLFATPWTAGCQASLSITNSRSLLKLLSNKLVMPSNHLITFPSKENVHSSIKILLTFQGPFWLLPSARSLSITPKPEFLSPLLVFSGGLCFTMVNMYACTQESSPYSVCLLSFHKFVLDIFRAGTLKWFSDTFRTAKSAVWFVLEHPTPVLLHGKSHGRRSLVGCSPWGREESDTTERLHFHFSLSCIGGGNGNPLQCSCLENPREGGASWAAIYGVAQSWTRLKRLSSSSSSSSREVIWARMETWVLSEAERVSSGPSVWRAPGSCRVLKSIAIEFILLVFQFLWSLLCKSISYET